MQVIDLAGHVTRTARVVALDDGGDISAAADAGQEDIARVRVRGNVLDRVDRVDRLRGLSRRVDCQQ